MIEKKGWNSIALQRCSPNASWALQLTITFNCEGAIRTWQTQLSSHRKHGTKRVAIKQAR
jgi:hypothetical protein